jgi:hypothetical protein
MDDYWEKAYTNTDYRVVDLDTVVRIGGRNEQLDHWLTEKGLNSFAIITAWNPMSEPVGLPENEAANQDLYQALEGKYTMLDASGSASDGSWPPEPSFLIGGIMKEEATRVASRFRQRAYVYGECGKTAQLVWPDYQTDNK